VLLELDRPKEALAQFERTLDIYRLRPAALLGAARASAKLHDRVRTERYVRELRNIWHRADDGHSGLAALAPITEH
jgi:hypothetical protein